MTARRGASSLLLRFIRPKLSRDLSPANLHRNSGASRTTSELLDRPVVKITEARTKTNVAATPRGWRREQGQQGLESEKGERETNRLLTRPAAKNILIGSDDRQRPEAAPLTRILSRATSLDIPPARRFYEPTANVTNARRAIEIFRCSPAGVASNAAPFRLSTPRGNGYDGSNFRLIKTVEP